MNSDFQDPLSFLQVSAVDVERWDMEWIRYFRKPEAQTYFREYNSADPKIRDVIREFDGKTSPEVFQTPGVASKKLLLWYNSRDILGKKVAEIGCGVGRVGRDIAAIVDEYIGLDYSELALYVAGLVGAPNCRFVSLRNKTELLKLQSKLDSVIFRNFFIHQPMENLPWLLELTYFLLKPSGVATLDFYWPDLEHDRRVEEGRAVCADQGKQQFPSTLYVFEDENIRQLINPKFFSLEEDHIMRRPPRRFYRIMKVGS